MTVQLLCPFCGRPNERVLDENSADCCVPGQVLRERDEARADGRTILRRLENQEAWEHFARQCLEAAIQELPEDSPLIQSIHAVLG